MHIIVRSYSLIFLKLSRLKIVGILTFAIKVLSLVLTDKIGRNKIGCKIT